MATGAAALDLVRWAHELTFSTTIVGCGSQLDHVLSWPSSEYCTLTLVRDSTIAKELDPTGHVVLDTFGLPRTMIFGFLLDVLELERRGKFRGQLQVFLDDGRDPIKAPRPGTGAMEVTQLGGSQIGPRNDPRSPTLWVPVLNEHRQEELLSMYRYLEPETVCPVLPFPAKNPRRADDLILEYRELLFEVMSVGMLDFIYAHESDPFDLYRTLLGVLRSHSRSFGQVVSASSVITPGSSKLRSIGAFLTAYELGIPLIWNCESYEPNATKPFESRPQSEGLTCIWLTGEPYRC